MLVRHGGGLRLPPATTASPRAHAHVNATTTTTLDEQYHWPGYVREWVGAWPCG